MSIQYVKMQNVGDAAAQGNNCPPLDHVGSNARQGGSGEKPRGHGQVIRINGVKIKAIMLHLQDANHGDMVTSLTSQVKGSLTNRFIPCRKYQLCQYHVYKIHTGVY